MERKIIPDRLEGVGFLSKRAGSFSEVPQRTVQSWTEKGLITPDISDTVGSGVRRLYSALNCIEIGIVKSLSFERLHFDRISFVMKFILNKTKLKKLLAEDEGFLILQLGTTRIITRPQVSVFGYSKDNPIDEEFLKQWHYLTTPLSCDKVLVINIGRIARRVLGEIKKRVG